MRIFNVDTGAFGKRVAISAIANIMASILDLISFLLVARILNVEELGTFLISLMIGTGVLRIGSPNLAQITMRAVIRAIDQKNNTDLRFLLQAGLACDLLLWAFALVAGTLTAYLLVPGNNPSLFAMVMLTVAISSIKPQVLSVAFPRAFGHHEVLYLWVFAGAALKVIFLYTVWSASGGYLGVLAAFFVWQIVPATGGLLLMVMECKKHGVLSVKRSTKQEFNKNHSDLVPLVRAGTLTVLPQLVFDLATPIVGGLAGVAQAGTFGLAAKIGQAARLYAEPLAYALYTEQCSDSEHGRWGRLATQTKIWAAGLCGVTVLAALVFKLVDQPFVELVFGSAYIAAIPTIQWCIIAAIPTTFAMPFQFGLFAMGHAHRVFRAEIAGAALFLGLLAAMPGQAVNAALALAASRLLASLASGFYFHRSAIESRRGSGTDQNKVSQKQSNVSDTDLY